MRRTFTLSVFLAAVAAQASWISEIALNPPGTDQGQEFIELMGTPGSSASGLSVLQIEGDAAANPGRLDTVFTVGAGTNFGSNGLLLVRDTSAVLNPAPASGTTVVLNDFTPDIENSDSSTWVLVSGFTGSAGQDLDTNDDGILDVLPWDSAIDSVAWGTTTNSFFEYAAQVGGTNLGIAVGINSNDFEPDWVYRLLNFDLSAPQQWAAADLNAGVVPGIPDLDPEERIGLPGYPFADPLGLTRTVNTWDPGNVNAGVVPEPGTLAVLALGLGVLRRRR